MRSGLGLQGTGIHGMVHSGLGLQGTVTTPKDNE